MAEESSRAWISPRPARLSIDWMLDGRAGDQLLFGVGRVRRDLIRDAVVRVQIRVVVTRQLRRAGSTLVVPDLRVEVDEVRGRLALENVQADGEARASDGRRVGYGGAGEPLALEVYELAEGSVIVSADHRYERFLCRHVLVDDR